MAIKKAKESEPTRHGTERLLRELAAQIPSYCHEFGEEHDRLGKAADELEAELLKAPKLLSLRAKIESIRDGVKRTNDARRNLLNKARRRFYANGPTPYVVRILNELIDELEKDSV